MRRALEPLLQRCWSGRGITSTLLLPVSWLYGGLVQLRRQLYRWGILATHTLPVPVVVVGNVLVGGVGKTPVVIALVQHWQARGLQVGVVARGYRRQTQDCREVRAKSLARDCGDEALLMHRRTGAPLFVARSRAQAARALLAAYPQTQVLISDDGLQHTAMARDIEIGVFDDRGLGNARLLPAGPLREPWPRHLDLCLSTGERLFDSSTPARRSLADYALDQDGSKTPLAALRGRALIAVAGIAQPERFFDMLRERGLTLQNSLALPDHFDFSRWQYSVPQSAVLLCTEKDAVKLWLRYPRALAVPMHLALTPTFLEQLDQLLQTAQRVKLSSLPQNQTG